jgi:UDP:flavonoid glycosyltransferase YjiC (YdhE family)
MRFRPLLEGCDLLVSHGGNVAPGALMAGVPQLVFPRQYEQYLTALRMEQVGCGLWLQEAAASHEVLPALKRVLGEPRFAAAARAFAARYAAFSPAEQQRRMVLRIEQILAKPPILSPSSTPKEQ